MSTDLLRIGLNLFSRLVKVGLLAGIVPEEPALVDVRDVHPNRGASVIATDLDHRAQSLDAVAGSEFVDDRIRLGE